MSEKLLGSIAEIRGRVGWKGYTVNDLTDSGPLVLGANEITSDNQLNLSTVKHLTREKYEESPEIFVKKDDILVVKVGSTIGKVAIVNNDLGEASINPNCVIVRAIEINPYYLYYYLCSPAGKAFLINNSAASGQPALNQTTLKKMVIPVIDEASQITISKFLNAINDKISNNISICSELEAMAKLIYDYWFVQFDFPDENGRPYKSSGGKMVWNKDLKREIPNGWEITTIGNITNCRDSERIPVANKDREKMKGNIPYYGATGIMGYVNKAIFSGDFVLLAEDGSVMDEKGHPIIQRVSGDAWINNHAHVLEPIKGYSCRLLMMVLKDVPVVKIKTGSIQMKINQENMNAYKIIDIPEYLVKLINKCLNVIDEKLLELESENQQLSSLRDFLLPMLMNGQVKVG